MLNISEVSTVGKVPTDKYQSFKKVDTSKAHKQFTRWALFTFALFLVILFLPWTQNIRAKGKVTTLRPGQRPQTVNSTIAGKIERWYVNEGQLVRAGDTIVFISEIKADYFDPQLVERTGRQVEAKEGAILSYGEKVRALQDLVAAMRAELEQKVKQIRNKVQQEQFKLEGLRADYEAAQNDYNIAKRQYERGQTMYEQDIVALKDLEDLNMKLQSANAKMVSAENKYFTSQNEVTNLEVQLLGIRSEYEGKIAKAQSDIQSTLSEQYDAEGTVNKLRSQYASYERRNTMYYVLAPQDCYITKTLKPGIGEIVKEGEPLISIMPADYELAVEMYVRPMDLPLVHIGAPVRFIFDGWPAFVFSGWPNQSFGTYAGRVVAIDNMISDNGLYRILISPDAEKETWPQALRVGSGAEGIALLNDVPLWYEFWRKLNGFPPDYYDDAEPLIKKSKGSDSSEDDEEKADEDPKLKAPVKSLK